MAQQHDEDSLGTCSFCGELKPIARTRPLNMHVIGRGDGPERAFWHTCQSCEAIPERRGPQPGQALSFNSTPPRDPWWNRD